GPQSPAVIPGGWSVYNNKLYLFGGFDPVGNVMIPDIWVFDPMAAPGSQWTHRSAVLTMARAYIATATIGNFIYLAGGSQIASPLTDETITEKYDVAGDAITVLSPMQTASSNFKGYTDGTLLYAPGGVFATPSNMMQVYNPASNTWTMSTSTLTHGARNYAKAIVGNYFYAIGGYDSTSTINNYNQRYNPPQACVTNTP